MRTDRSETVFRMENDLMFNKQESGGGSHIYAHTLLSKGVTCLGQSITTSSHGSLRHSKIHVFTPTHTLGTELD